MKLLLILVALALMAVGCTKKEAETAKTAPSNTPEKKKEQPAASAPGQSGDTTITASGLKFIELQLGTGATPTAGQTCVTHYTIWLTDGKKVHSSRDNGQPFEFKLGAGQVIKGWEEGLATMKIGGHRKLFIRPELAWAERGFGNGMVPPNASVVFEVELLGLK